MYIYIFIFADNNSHLRFSVFDFSDSNFTVINQDLTVVTPDGEEQWLTSSTNDITWTDDISGDVKIDLYKADVFYSEVVAATTSDGLYSWTIPDTIVTSSDILSIHVINCEVPACQLSPPFGDVTVIPPVNIVKFSSDSSNSTG